MNSPIGTLCPLDEPFEVKMSALDLAVGNDHKEIVELLIAKDADVHAKIFPHKDAKPDTGRTVLHGAAFMGHEEIVELLIANVPNVNSKDQKGKIPLDWVRSSEHPDVAALLFKPRR